MEDLLVILVPSCRGECWIYPVLWSLLMTRILSGRDILTWKHYFFFPGWVQSGWHAGTTKWFHHLGRVKPPQIRQSYGVAQSVISVNVRCSLCTCRNWGRSRILVGLGQVFDRSSGHSMLRTRPRGHGLCQGGSYSIILQVGPWCRWF